MWWFRSFEVHGEAVSSLCFSSATMVWFYSCEVLFRMLMYGSVATESKIKSVRSFGVQFGLRVQVDVVHSFGVHKVRDNVDSF